MNISIKILSKAQILDIMPLMIEYTKGNTETTVLEARFVEMASQNYECVAMYDEDKTMNENQYRIEQKDKKD